MTESRAAGKKKKRDYELLMYTKAVQSRVRQFVMCSRLFVRDNTSTPSRDQSKGRSPGVDDSQRRYTRDQRRYKQDSSVKKVFFLSFQQLSKVTAFIIKIRKKLPLFAQPKQSKFLVYYCFLFSHLWHFFFFK